MPKKILEAQGDCREEQGSWKMGRRRNKDSVFIVVRDRREMEENG